MARCTSVNGNVLDYAPVGEQQGKRLDHLPLEVLHIRVDWGFRVVFFARASYACLELL